MASAAFEDIGSFQVSPDCIVAECGKNDMTEI